MSAPWADLANFTTGYQCTCSDSQLTHVGCDCDARQNLPVQCGCGEYLRSQAELDQKECRSCIAYTDINNNLR